MPNKLDVLLMLPGFNIVGLRISQYMIFFRTDLIMLPQKYFLAILLLRARSLFYSFTDVKTRQKGNQFETELQKGRRFAIASVPSLHLILSEGPRENYIQRHMSIRSDQHSQSTYIELKLQNKYLHIQKLMIMTYSEMFSSKVCFLKKPD